jgi:putative addiction module component (TIGR02574 family)
MRTEKLKNEIASSNEELPLPEWQKKELSKRLDAYDQGEIESTAWQQVHEELKNSYK